MVLLSFRFHCGAVAPFFRTGPRTSLRSRFDNRDQDVLRSDAVLSEPLDNGPVKLLLSGNAVHMHHGDPYQHQVLAVYVVVTRVEFQLTGVVGTKDLEKVVWRDTQCLDLGLVDGSTELLVERVEQLPLKIDLDQGHCRSPSGLSGRLCPRSTLIATNSPARG